MGIVVKHSGNAAPLVAASYEGGRGKRRAQDRAREKLFEKQRSGSQGVRRGRKDLADTKKHRDVIPSRTIESTQLDPRGGNKLKGPTVYPYNQPDGGAGRSSKTQEYMEKKQIDNLYDAEQRKRDAKKDDATQRTERSEYDYKEGMDRREYDYKQGVDQREYDYRQDVETGQSQAELDREAQEEFNEKHYETSFSNIQRAKFEDLGTQIESVMSSSDLNPEEKADAVAQLEAQQDAIKPSRHLKEETPDKNQLLDNLTVEDKYGDTWVLDPKGGAPKRSPREPDTSEADAMKREAEKSKNFADNFKFADESIVKKRTEVVNDDDGNWKSGGVEIPSTNEEVMAKMKELAQLRKEYEDYVNPQPEDTDTATDGTDGTQQRPDDESPGMVESGNIDIDNRQVVRNRDGSISTEQSFSVGIDGEEVLLPKVIDGKVVSIKEAVEHYHKTGEHLGKFETPEAADAYAEKLHLRQEEKHSTPAMPAAERAALEKAGQDPDRRGGYSDWTAPNGKRIPNDLAPFLGTGGQIDEDAIKEFAKIEAEKRRGTDRELSEDDIISSVTLEFKALLERK